MSFEGYFTEHDDVLENKLGITDPDELKEIETEIVAIRMSELLSSPPKGKMDFSYLRKIHLRLFSDIYSMAGKVRTVDMAKGGSVFCYVQFLEDEQQRVFKWVADTFTRRKKPRDEFIEALAKLSAELNALHPFREGNGRAIRTFLILLATRYRYHLNFDLTDTEHIMNADIAAFHGDYEPLIRLYNEILEQD